MDTKLLDSFFNGNCSPEQVDEIIAAYYSGELSDDVAERLRKYLRDYELADKEANWDSTRLFGKITQEIYGERSLPVKHLNRSSKNIQKPSLYPLWLRIAAGVSVLLIISFFLIQQSYDDKYTENQVAETDYVVKSTSHYERLTVRMNDGSQVILNTGSKITYRKDFDPGQRAVTLEGEAFFVVEKDKSRPFSVTANGVVTTALGTSFNVNTRLDKAGEVEIALVEGRVKVHKDQEKGNKTPTALFLNPGEKLAIGSESPRLSSFNFKETIGWKDGIIYFESIPFEMVVSKLQNSYNVDIEVVYRNQEHKRQRYSGEFRNKSLEYILQNLSFSSEFNFEIEGDKVKIVFK